MTTGSGLTCWKNTGPRPIPCRDTPPPSGECYYSVPPLPRPRSFGVAGPGSGVPFHFHGPGWAEAVYGRKRWFLAPPDSPPDFHPNKTTLQWLLQVCAALE